MRIYRVDVGIDPYVGELGEATDECALQR